MCTEQNITLIILHFSVAHENVTDLDNIRTTFLSVPYTLTSPTEMFVFVHAISHALFIIFISQHSPILTVLWFLESAKSQHYCPDSNYMSKAQKCKSETSSKCAVYTALELCCKAHNTSHDTVTVLTTAHTGRLYLSLKSSEWESLESKA